MGDTNDLDQDEKKVEVESEALDGVDPEGDSDSAVAEGAENIGKTAEGPSSPLDEKAGTNSNSDLVESSSEEIVAADSEEPVAPEAAAPKKSAGKMPVIAGAVVAVVAIVAVVLSMTIFSPQTKADKLYEQGSYAEALEAYMAIDDEDKNGAKMSGCRYWMFVN